MSERYVKVAEGSLSYIKELMSRAREHDIDASLEQCRKKS